MDPAPGAWTTIDVGDGVHTDVKIHGARAVGARHAVPLHRRPPGTLDSADGVVTVWTADGTVSVTDVQPAGRRRMPAAEWLRGANLSPDVRFE